MKPTKEKVFTPSLPDQQLKTGRAPRNRRRYGSIRPPKEPPYSARVYNQSHGNPRFCRQIPRSYRGSLMHIDPIIKNGPITPQEALAKYSPLLTNFERTEIEQFPEIYFLGTRNRKIEPNYKNHFNIGFDNAAHNYNIVIGDHLAYRFEVLNVFGAGSFGTVVRCTDHKINKNVAVKIIISTDQMHEQGQIEARILSRLNQQNCPYIVRAFDFFIFRSHICITYEILGKNLYEVSQSNGFKPLPVETVKNYAFQILKALEVCHRSGIIHCDLKPENVLVTTDNKQNIKLIDFGSSCFEGYQKYEYIQSRFYRAPEVILGINYGPPMDIWSFGLIIVELLIGKPLFPGNSEMEQLEMISEVLGPPHPGLVKVGKRKKEFFDESYRLKRIKGTGPRKPKSTPLASALNSGDPFYIDFIQKCLTWDQALRMTATQALQHPWLNIKEIQPSSSKTIKTMLPELNH